MKLAWIAVSGSDAESALARLEVIADTYLSVNAPMQHAAKTLLEQRRGLQPMLRQRVGENLAELDRQLAAQEESLFATGSRRRMVRDGPCSRDPIRRGPGDRPAARNWNSGASRALLRLPPGRLHGSSSDHSRPRLSRRRPAPSRALQLALNSTPPEGLRVRRQYPCSAGSQYRC